MAQGDIKTFLPGYIHPDTRQGLIFLRERTKDDPEPVRAKPATVESVVLNGRNHASSISLDKAGFALAAKHPTSLSTADFYKLSEDPALKQCYYAEMEDLLKRESGASHVVVFHHQVRNTARATGALGSTAGVQPYTHIPPTQTPPRSPQRPYFTKW